MTTIPEELKGKDKAAVVAFVSAEASKQLLELSKIAQSDPVKYAEKLTSVLAGQSERVDLLLSAIKKADVDSKAATEKAEKDAAEATKIWGGKLDALAVTSLQPLSEGFSKLPSTIHGYVTFRQVSGKVVIKGFTSKGYSDITPTKGKANGKRGRKSKWSCVAVKLPDVAEAKKFPGLDEARVVFTKPIDRERKYGEKTFTAQCENYGYTVEFTVRGADKAKATTKAAS